MNLMTWLRSLLRPAFFEIYLVQLDKLAPHRLHVFGRWGGSTPDVGKACFVQRHSILDLQTGEIADAHQHSEKDGPLLADQDFIAQALAAYRLQHGDCALVPPPMSALAVAYRHENQSDTEDVPKRLANGIEVMQSNWPRFHLELIRDGATLARHRMNGVVRKDSLRVFAMPTPEYVLVMQHSGYLWLDAATGRRLQRGTI